MSEDKQIVKSDILPGGLGNIWVGGINRELSAIKIDKSNGSVTITIGAVKDNIPIIEDVDFEVILPKRIENKNVT